MMKGGSSMEATKRTATEPPHASGPIGTLPKCGKKSRSEVRHVKTRTGRHSKVLSVYRLAFDDVVSGLLKVKAADIVERAGQKAETRPSKSGKGSRQKG